MISTETAAEMLGVSRRRVVAMVHAGILDAEKVSGVWLVDEDSVRERIAKPGAKGRPRKGYGMGEQRYTLMRRNEPVCKFSFDTSARVVTGVVEEYNPELAPVGTVHGNEVSPYGLLSWLSERRIPDTRRNLKAYLRAYGVGDTQDLAFKTFGLSLTDQYWFLPEGASDMRWEDINAFDNDYEHAKFRNPGHTTSGMLDKFWEKRDGRDVLVKMGGLFDREPFNEVLSTRLLGMLLDEGEYVPYWLERHDGRPCSVCENMVDGDYELVHMSDVMRSEDTWSSDSTYARYKVVLESHGLDSASSSLSKMIVFDYLVGNYDRHDQNLGIIRDSHTNDWVRVAPIYDNGNGFYMAESNPGRLANRLYLYESNPFSEYPSTQLAMAEDFSWFDPDRLAGFEDVVVEVLGENENVSEELAVAIASQFGRRLEKVVDIASEREGRTFFLNRAVGHDALAPGTPKAVERDSGRLPGEAHGKVR